MRKSGTAARRARPARVFWAAAALALLAGPAAALPERAVYDLFLGGLRLGDLRVSTERDGARYRARAALATSGWLGAFVRFALDARAEGRVGAEGLEPERFTAQSQSSRRGERLLEIRYEGRRPVAVDATPPFDPKPWEIEPSLQEGAADPLSAFLAAAASAPDTEPCDRVGDVFDGRRRYRVILSPVDAAGPAGPGLRRCAGRYRRVAGFKPKFMARPDIAFDVWFEPAADGGFAFLRAIGETPLGTAVIRRRR